MRASGIVLAAIGLLGAAVVGRVARGEVVELAAKDTLSVVEMDHGDVLNFRLRSGRVCTIALETTSAAIVEKVERGGVVYRFSLGVRIDGQPITLRRYGATSAARSVSASRTWLTVCGSGPIRCEMYSI